MSDNTSSLYRTQSWGSHAATAAMVTIHEVSIGRTTAVRGRSIPRSPDPGFR